MLGEEGKRYQSLLEDPAHAAFMFQGQDNDPGRKAYIILLEAKPGKEEKLQRFLQDIHDGINKEPLTGPWFALRFSQTTFAIFEAFPDVAARYTHNDGPGGRTFLKKELLHEVLAYPAQLHRLDVLHGKFDVLFGEKVSTV